MPIKTIPLSRLEENLAQTLTECSESGDTVVVELPEGNLLAIHSLDPQDDDDLVDDLIASNPRFKALLERSKSSPRKAFPFPS